VIVFFTPPQDQGDVEKLRALGVDVRLVENSTNAFAAFDEKRHFGEKTWISTVEDDTVVFLDCDTLVFGDIRDVTRGDFQFKARPGTSQVRQPEWRELFERFGEAHMDWMPNAGFLVFKRGLHREIGETWREYVQTDLKYQHGVNHKEQYALALAVGDSDLERMSEKEHVMLWNNEYPADGIVYHVGKTLENLIESGPETFRESMKSGLENIIQGNI
jgi:hypothetical protein